jgi:hypothetical protein
VALALACRHSDRRRAGEARLRRGVHLYVHLTLAPYEAVATDHACISVATAKLPTTHGVVELAWTFDAAAGKLIVNASLPVNTAATVKLPSSAGRGWAELSEGRGITLWKGGDSHLTSSGSQKDHDGGGQDGEGSRLFKGCILVAFSSTTAAATPRSMSAEGCYSFLGVAAVGVVWTIVRSSNALGFVMHWFINATAAAAAHGRLPTPSSRYSVRVDPRPSLNLVALLLVSIFFESIVYVNKTVSTSQQCTRHQHGARACLVGAHATIGVEEARDSSRQLGRRKLERARGHGSLLTCCGTARGTPGRPARRVPTSCQSAAPRHRSGLSSQGDRLQTIARRTQARPNATVGPQQSPQHWHRSKDESRPLIGMLRCSAKTLGQAAQLGPTPSKSPWGGVDLRVVVGHKDRRVLDVVDLSLYNIV